MISDRPWSTEESTTADPALNQELSMRMMVRLAAAISAAAVIVAVSPLAAASVDDDTSNERITWSVTPSGQAGPDGRSRIELELDAGAEKTEYLAVRNLSATAATFGLSAADGYLTSTGRFDMLPADEPSVDAGTWIAMDESVTVRAGGTAVIPFIITIPDDATPGDHSAGVAATISSTAASDEGAAVGLESRVGFRVLLRVKGELAPSLTVKALTGEYSMSWNPFEPRSVSVAYSVENTGNARLSVTATIAASGRIEDPKTADAAELLPGGDGTFVEEIDGVWPFGLSRVVVSLDAVTTPDGASADSESSEVWIWAVPWSQLAVLGGAGLIVAALIGGRRRRTKEVQRLIAEARDDGARSTAY